MAIRRPEEVEAFVEGLTGCPNVATPMRLKYWRKVRRGPEATYIEGRVYYADENIIAWLESQGILLRRPSADGGDAA